MKLLMMLAVFAFALAGCRSGEKAQLDAPLNIRYQDDTIAWDAVAEATRYLVRIEGVETERVTTTTYDVRHLDDGTYTVQVRAQRGDDQSPYSDPLTFTIERDTGLDLTTPTNLQYADDDLTWDAVDEATTYVVEVDDVETAVVESPTYSVLHLDNGTYTVRVRAQAGDSQSPYSDPFTFTIEREVSVDLDAPENLRFADDMVMWDAVDGATQYVLTIDDMTSVVVNSPSYSVDHLTNGTYTVRVRAQTGDKQSPYSDTLTFTIDRDIVPPLNLTFDGDTLTWTHTGADAFHVYLNDQLHDTVATTSIDLADVFADIDAVGSTRIHVTAHIGDDASGASMTMIYRVARFRHDLESTVDPLIALRYAASPIAFTRNGTGASLSHVIVDGTLLTLNHDALNTLGLGEHELIVQTTRERIRVDLSVVDEGKPYVAGDINHYYRDGEDVVVTIELFDADITIQLDAEHYSFDGAVLTVSSAYFDGRLSNTPDASNLLFSFYFEYDNTTVFSFVNVRVIE